MIKLNLSPRTKTISTMLLLQRDQIYGIFVSVLLFSAVGKVVCYYAWPLPNGFPVGSRIVLKGIPPIDKSYKVFGVNLLAYNPFGNDGDIDFHLAARYGEGNIAFNNLILGKSWQQEILKRDAPIQGGKPFEIRILSEPSHFSVYINESHYFDFPHRMPLQRIQYLQIVASIILSQITVDTAAVYTWPLLQGFPANQKITIIGTPTVRNIDQEFSVNFQNCPSYGKDCYVAFRMLVQYEKKVVVNNSYQKGVGWGQPEIHSNSPITIGRTFVISVTKESNHFKVYINEKQLCTFTLREPHSDFTHLVLKGTVDVTSIAMS